MKTSKIYSSFADKFGNGYSYSDFASFASFWYNISRKNAMSLFPDNFKALQNAAFNSKEARTKLPA